MIVKPAAAAKPVSYRAKVTNLEALVHAVAGGLAPLSVQQGSLFSMAGVTLVNATA